MKGTIWVCTDEGSEYFGRYCVVKEASTHPDLNGDGDLEAVYANGERIYTKVRRFVVRHDFVNHSKKSLRDGLEF